MSVSVNGGASVAVDSDFSERSFFLKAFQGRYLTFVLSQTSDLTPESLSLFQHILSELVVVSPFAHREGSRILILYEAHAKVLQALQPLLGFFAKQMQHIPLASSVATIPSVLWQATAAGTDKRIVALALAKPAEESFIEQVVRLGLQLRMSRLLWLEQEGGISDEQGQIQGFFNSARLADLLRSTDLRRYSLLHGFQRLLAGGVKAIVLCRMSELEQELFTYQGRGSFFSRHPYCRVRRLGLDDFAQSVAIIRKGEQEGFLLPRSDELLAQVLAGSFGAFILEDRLAGLCSLHTAGYQEEKMGEIVSLYTLTRFQGVGVGRQLLSHLVQEARQQGLLYLFACTRHEPVAAFFQRCRLGRHRHSFYRVAAEELPAAKWQGYDPLRKQQMICLRLNLGE
ncbi:GNAT family N-acetyltransferase [Candidatus Magnetaquicoccus inordinatus]|uniref:GNAT family N-acetyltransferase n=1 Tax=Candidatus Magnetaquicoccus inordinatus TaxID=2496818 RepID=UPI00187D207F|nr:GNAT family N-acetyltransferase [Candidatus Magnetaquicoccus inordinatus]